MSTLLLLSIAGWAVGRKVQRAVRQTGYGAAAADGGVTGVGGHALHLSHAGEDTPAPFGPVAAASASLKLSSRAAYPGVSALAMLLAMMRCRSAQHQAFAWKSSAWVIWANIAVSDGVLGCRGFLSWGVAIMEIT